jgi:hypothetical protein
MKNWKTNLFGVLAILFTFAGPVLEAYFPIRGLNWVALMTALAGLAGGTGLLVARDYNVHSTITQVDAATATATPEAKAKEEQAVGKAAINEVKKQ